MIHSLKHSISIQNALELVKVNITFIVMYIIGYFYSSRHQTVRWISYCKVYELTDTFNHLSSIIYVSYLSIIMYLSPSCINHKSIMYLLSRYLSSTYHRFVIYLSYIYYLSILYLLSSNHISIISLPYIFHLPLIYLSYIYHPSIIYLLSIYHKSIIYLSYIYCRRGRCKEQRRMPPNVHEQRLHSCELDVM